MSATSEPVRSPGVQDIRAKPCCVSLMLVPPDLAWLLACVCSITSKNCYARTLQLLQVHIRHSTLKQSLLRVLDR